MIHYTLRCDGKRSTDRSARSMAGVKSAVRAAHRQGSATWAERSDGSFIWGLNDAGRPRSGAGLATRYGDRRHRVKGKHRA